MVSLSAFNIYLLRHGELVKTGILCGRTDIALSAVGEQQLSEATNRLPQISLCFSSPLNRCREFAQRFCQQQRLPLHISPHLQEMDFGEWDGKSYQSLWQRGTSGEASDEGGNNATVDSNTPTLGAFWQNPWQCMPPNGEPMQSFTSRVDTIWQEIIEQLQNHHANNNFASRQGTDPEISNALVFTHGGVIRYLLAKVLQLPIPGTLHMTNIDIPYGALIHIQLFIDPQGNVWPKLML